LILKELYKVQRENGSVSDKKYEDMQLKLAKKKEEIANLQEQLQKVNSIISFFYISSYKSNYRL
jgi:hypothetical protein